jgi:CHAT domain-containing protein
MPAQDKPIKLLAIIQPDTPGHRPLPRTQKELKIIEKHTAQHQRLTTLSRTKATVDNVMSEMDKCSWVHLACQVSDFISLWPQSSLVNHRLTSVSVQNLDRPTKSSFLLYNGGLELSKIISKSFPHADFAYLSACQTATGDLKQTRQFI